jgi:hypothetical protein
LIGHAIVPRRIATGMRGVTGDWTMKKFLFAVVIAAIAASPAAAAAKKKKAVRAPAPVASTNNNENSWKFAKDSLPIFLPSWSIPVYLSAKNAR